MIEGGQILDRASATSHNDYVHVVSFVEMTNPVRNFERRRFSLYLRGKNQNVRRAMAPVENVEDVAQGSRLRRSHDADSARK